jgi:signal transduction histidine kinase
MAAVGALVAGVAHEVRNPLFSMTATLDAFEARAGGQTSGPHLSVLRAQLERLQQLMRELLEYGKPPQLVLAATDLRETLRQATEECEPLAAQHGVRLQWTAPDELPHLHGDQPRLVQVFVNLVANAVQHCPRGATVQITASDVRENGRSWLVTRVEDEGSGFQAQDLTRVFEPFFTRRRGGTGLGLALVQRITEQHGGQVFAANREGRGAVVTVHLPYAT